MRLTPCHSRRDLPGEQAKFFCAHPQVSATHSVVTPEVCRICPYPQQPAPATFREYTPVHPLFTRDGECFYLGEQTGWRDCPTCRGNVRLKVFHCLHPSVSETTYDDCGRCIHYERRLARGGVREWAVGVTTAPRSIPTLVETLQGLQAAGWEAPRLFAEPDTEIPREFAGLPISQRDVMLGAFSNWLLGLEELVLRQPAADAYFLCQDDVLLSRNLRQYLERELWPAERLGVVSIYCPAPHARSRREGFHVERLGSEAWGALAYLFPNAAARRLLTDPLVLQHRLRGANGGHTGIDTVIGEWCGRSGLEYWVHQPSLARHIGESSSLFPTARASGFRQAEEFVADMTQWPQRGPPSESQTERGSRNEQSTPTTRLTD